MWSMSLPYTVILVLGSIAILALAVYAWVRRPSAGAFPFIGLMIAGFLYAFGYAFELASTRIAGMLFWTRVEYLGNVAIPIFWLLLAGRATGRTRWLTKPVLSLMVGLSAVTLFLNWTSPLHRLFYRAVSVSTAGPFPLIQTEKAAWYWVHQAYMNLAIVAGTMMLLSAFVRSTAAYRRQTAAMVGGALLPWLAYGFYILGWSPYGIDTGPFGLILAGPIFALVLFRFRLLDLVPVARDAVFMGMIEGVVVADAHDRIIDFNPAAQRLFPGLAGASIGRPIAETLGRHPAAHGLLAAGAGTSAEISVEIDGRLRFYEARLSLIRNSRGRVACRSLSFSDSTEQAVLRQRLSSLATTDELTGAANRRAFLEVGRRETARAKRSGHALSLIILDLDHFKSINDRWGHAAGDAALVEACRRMKSSLRTADTLGRHGGEEFAVLLPETPPAQAVLVAERLRAAIAKEPLPIRGSVTVDLTASFGVAGVDRVNEESVENLIRAADRAMYQAKTSGRGCVRLANDIATVELPEP
jgi:diguanylate cyclase (GGDEF)-like protein